MVYDGKQKIKKMIVDTIRRSVKCLIANLNNELRYVYVTEAQAQTHKAHAFD